MHKQFKISGTHCHSCKALLEEVIGELPGVQSVSVDPATGASSIEHDATLDWAKLKQEVAALGDYRVANEELA